MQADGRGSIGHSQLAELAREELHEPERAPVALDHVVDETIGRTRQNYPQLDFAAELEPTSQLGTRGPHLHFEVHPSLAATAKKAT